ncbi:single-stranded-DNA-specific exonuclease RecJ [Microbacteriaceae bacterium 4G12]
MLQANTRWRKKEYNDDLVKQLAQSLQLTPFVTSLLMNRGIETEEEIRDFLHTNDQTFHDPFLMKDMDRTVARIEAAIASREQILIFGDYDADGVSSTTVMLLALQELGADVEFYIPNRFTEGYGPNEGAFRWAKQAGFSLIITVDTGISAVNEAKLAKELGIDLIITDHHEPPPVLPEAYSIIHPKIEGSTYPFHELAGVGVAFKLAHALLKRVPEHLLEIAVIGTIADLVPLRGENRLIAKRGIEKLRNTKRLGLQALLRVANIAQSDISEDSVGFAIGPRINAIGRLEDAAPAVHLLLTDDAEEAKELAEEIDSLNKLRQDIVREITEEAIQEVETHYPPEENKVLVLAKEGWNAGVIGIVASKLVERYYRPTIMLSIDREKQTAKGSARSIEGFDLFANLSDCRDILPHFGGHTMAAGMTLSLDDVDELRERLNTLAKQQLTEEDFIPITSVDAVCSLDEITIATIEEMQQLAPFGMGNPKPRVQVNDVSLESIRQIGSDGSHLKLTLQDGQAKLDSVGFGFGAVAEEISPLARVSLVGEVTINEWNNFRKPQLMIQDIAVRHFQLFDWRSMRNIEKHLALLPRHLLRIVYFHEDTLTKFSLQGYEQIVSAQSIIDKKEPFLQDAYVVLLDVPSTIPELAELLKYGFPSRIYTVFYQETQHTFSTVPTRDHFKWYYSFLHQKAPFSLKLYGEQLCKYKGWSKDTVNFMTKVFFELEFVTIKDGVISVASEVQKRDLTESKTYREKLNQLQLEKEFVYSTYQQLQAWFEAIHNGSFIHEEAFL